MSADKDEKILKKYDREGRNTSSSDPKMMNARVFIGNLAADKVSRQDVMKLFQSHGKVLGVSLHRSYGFVQFDKEEDAEAAVKAIHGKTVEGLRVDCNIATERRKESQQERRGGFSSRGSNRRHRSPSPPYRHRDRYEMEHHSRYERGGWRGSPPPMGPPLRERDREQYYDRFLPPPVREPYSRLRDDPYERYGRERFPPPLPPPRDFLSYGGPRDLPSPRERYPSDYPPRWGSPEFDHRGPERERHLSMEREREWERERERERRPRPEAPPLKLDVGRDRRPVDMEIVVINRQQRDYAAVVSSRVQTLGLVSETRHLSPTVSLADALDDAAQQGLLYAIIITSQHEMHRSVTLTILHGQNPQEHKNMPLDDALALIYKDFEHYVVTLKESRASVQRKPAVSDDISQLLGRAASGAPLSSHELSNVISALQKQKGKEESDGTHGKYPSDKEPNSAEDIQRQQEDLQAKILSLLGSNAVVPSANSPPSQQPARSSTYSTTRTVSYPQPGASSNSYSSSYGSSSDGVGSGGGGGGGGGGYGSCAYNYR